MAFYDDALSEQVKAGKHESELKNLMSAADYQNHCLSSH